jgi:hypothetical protein
MYWGNGRCLHVLVGKPEGTRPIGRPRHRWEDNIEMDFFMVEWEGGKDWIDVAQNTDRWCAFVNVVMNLQIP